MPLGGFDKLALNGCLLFMHLQLETMKNVQLLIKSFLKVIQQANIILCIFKPKAGNVIINIFAIDSSCCSLSTDIALFYKVYFIL